MRVWLNSPLTRVTRAQKLDAQHGQGEIGFLSDIRRMNLGMTHARSKLLLVGDSSTFCRPPFFGELLAYAKGAGGIGQRVRWVNRPDAAAIQLGGHKPMAACALYFSLGCSR